MAATDDAHPDPHPDLPGQAQARWRNAGRVPPGRPPAEVGICASGGGIRSASVTLGALQALRREVLLRARYLVSVSGGGYMTGAFQLALTRANPEAESLAAPGDVFTPGSAEEDHLRRHGKYLADGGREWLTALGVVLRGVAASLGLLTLGVVVIGVGLSAFYRAAPVVDVTRLLPRFDPASGPEPAAFPAPTDSGLVGPGGRGRHRRRRLGGGDGGAAGQQTGSAWPGWPATCSGPPSASPWWSPSTPWPCRRWCGR